MTPEQIRIVKKTWRGLMLVDAAMVADLFYSKLFTDHPKLRKLFPKDMTSQNLKLTDMLTSIISSLENMDKMNDEISAMARRHTGYGVKPEHYDYVGSALLWTLEKGLAAEWNEEVKTAWLTCYQTLAAKMLTPAEQK
jgi:nitric oxide dioxygenase